jgi:hypothetical protein
MLVPLAAVVMVMSAAGIRAQVGAKKGEWSTYGGDLGHTRYAPLDQITAANFSSLEVKWRFKTDNLGPRPEFNFESTPLMVNGRLYSTAGAAGRRCTRCGDGRAAMGTWRAGRRARRRCSAPAVGPGPRVLDRRA